MILTQEVQEKWKPIQSVILRFIFTYFALYILLMLSQSFLETPLRWFADSILGWGGDFEMKSTGSGDMTMHYVVFGFNVFLAVIISTFWCLLDRKRASYNQLFYWLQAILRLMLLVMMLLYGFAKIFKGQFPDPSFERLLQPVGDMSPMGLAWTFMGHSIVYNIFIGFAEALGGILMLYRKTVTLGSLIVIGVMGNVAMMNLTYDIPVKLFSIHLVLMGVILLLSDGRRVFNFFFRNKTAEKVNRFTLSNDRTYIKIVQGTKIVVLVFVGGLMAFQSFASINVRDQLKMKSKFYGIWETQTFIRNNDTVPALTSDGERWRYLLLNHKKKASIKYMNDALDRFKFKSDTLNYEVELRHRYGDTISYQLNYHFRDSITLELQGVFEGDSLQILFKRKPITDFRLLNRGFHWVNESPYNR